MAKCDGTAGQDAAVRQHANQMKARFRRDLWVKLVLLAYGLSLTVAVVLVVRAFDQSSERDRLDVEAQCRITVENRDGLRALYTRAAGGSGSGSRLHLPESAVGKPWAPAFEELLAQVGAGPGRPPGLSAEQQATLDGSQPSLRCVDGRPVEEHPSRPPPGPGG